MAKKNKNKILPLASELASEKVGLFRKIVPKNAADKTTLSVVLFNQHDLDRIGEICLPKAGGNEFQVFYRSLQVIVKDPETRYRVVFTIPTVYFNMTQHVTSASIDFNLEEIDANAEAVKPISMEKAKEIAASFPISYFKEMGFEVTLKEEDTGSIHRHPSASGFSGVDTRNDPDNPGIIYRNAVRVDKIQPDSVMYVSHNTAQNEFHSFNLHSGGVYTPDEGQYRPDTKIRLAVTETRVVDVNYADPENEEAGIAGTYARTPTIAFVYQSGGPEKDFGEIFFGEESDSDIIPMAIHRDNYDKTPEALKKMVLGFFENSGYSATIVVDPDLIKPTGYQHHTKYNGRYGNYTNGYSTTKHTSTSRGWQPKKMAGWRFKMLQHELSAFGVEDTSSLTGELTYREANNIKSLLQQENITKEVIKSLLEKYEFEDWIVSSVCATL